MFRISVEYGVEKLKSKVSKIEKVNIFGYFAILRNVFEIICKINEKRRIKVTRKSHDVTMLELFGISKGNNKCQK